MSDVMGWLYNPCGFTTARDLPGPLLLKSCAQRDTRPAKSRLTV